jgi:hypothetical protein
MDWRNESSCRVPTLQAQDPEFKPQSNKRQGGKKGEREKELTASRQR